jgi:hypothetical protein
MAKKHWIYIKRGLSEDPKHRAAMGECIWLFMHIIDRSDWETGIVHDWKDAQEAAEMGMPYETLRYQRKKLDDLEYIQCKQKQHSQDIYIMEWKNPRDYGSEVKNPRFEDGNGFPPSNSEGGNQGNNQDGNQVLSPVTVPTLDSESSSSSDKKNSFDLEQADLGWMLLNGDKVTQRQLDKQKALKDFEEMLEVQFRRFPLNWIAFDETAKENFRKFIKALPEDQSLEKFVDWWMSDEKRVSSPPFTMAIIMQRWPQAFVQKAGTPPAEYNGVDTPFTRAVKDYVHVPRKTFAQMMDEKEHSEQLKDQ